MSGRTGFVVSAAFAALALMVAARGSAQESEPGERIMNGSCQGCHTVRVIQVQAMDAEAWTKSITTMVDKGAKVSKDEMPVLVDYLVKHHGPIPDGPGKQIVLNTCTMCHDLGRIKLGRRSSEEWEETLVSMLNEGAPLSDDDFVVVQKYLAEHFGLD
jgi:cytochrome c5